MQTFLSKVSQGYKFIRRLADKAIVGIVDEDGLYNYFGFMSKEQAAHPDISGVVASTESGDAALPNGQLMYLSNAITPKNQRQ